MTFTATPATGFAVASWTLNGQVVQTGGTVFTVSNVKANASVGVTFSILTFTITPTAGANGTISPSVSETVNYGSSISLTATPSFGCQVVAWTVNGKTAQTGGSSFVVQNVTANCSVQVTFSMIQFAITASAGAGGTMTPSGTQMVNYAGNMTFQATPIHGYLVSEWYLDGSPAWAGGSSCLLSNVTANHSVKVTFVKQTFTVSTSAGSHGTINPAGPMTVNYGCSVAFYANPSSGYVVDKWTVDGTSVQNGGGTFVLPKVTANHTVAATFKILMYTVTPSAGANGTVSPSTAQTVNYGTSLTFKAVPATGYKVAIWTLNGKLAQTGGIAFTIPSVMASYSVQVTFSTVTVTVRESSGANGGITPNTPQTVNYGSSMIFTATPNRGYTTVPGPVDGIAVQTGGTTFTLANITANHSVQVSFNIA